MTLALIVLSTAALLFACADSANQAVSDVELASAGTVEAGRLTYMTYCLNCHGEEGQGNGPLTQLITVEPANLTLLAEANGGSFPEDRVEGVIRNYEEELMIAHGQREMPIWEEVWRERLPSANADEVIDERIDQLIAYLKTIQS